jgi:hypothetical protein
MAWKQEILNFFFPCETLLPLTMEVVCRELMGKCIVLICYASKLSTLMSITQAYKYNEVNK